MSHYELRDAEGRFVGRAGSSVGAHRASRRRNMAGSVSRMTGYAPLAKAYTYADSAFRPGTLLQYITRPRYATLAEMARNGGDLQFSEVGKRNTRLRMLEKYGLVRRKPQLHRWELTAEGWRVLNESEAAWRLVKENQNRVGVTSTYVRRGDPDERRARLRRGYEEDLERAEAAKRAGYTSGMSGGTIDDDIARLRRAVASLA